MNINYNVLTGITMPEVVQRSNNWRKLRDALDVAGTGDAVCIHLSRTNYPSDEDMRKATETSRAGAYSFADGADIAKNGLVVRTTARWVRELPAATQQMLDSKYGITNPDDRVLICRKVRTTAPLFSVVES